MARASRLSAVGGKLKSARAKIGGACSQAMSAWKTSGMTPAIASVLGKCRSQARMRNQASNARLGGNEARAQTLEKRADRGLTMKERLARAKELRARRQGRVSSSVQEQAAPVASKPAAEAPKPVRYGDTYRDHKMRKIEKGISQRGELVMGYDHAPDTFTQSAATGRMIRKYVVMSDGTRVHPSTLVKHLPAQNRAKAIRKMENDAAAERTRAAAVAKEKLSRAADDKHGANVRYAATRRPMEGSYFAKNSAGKVVRVEGGDAADSTFYRSQGFRRVTMPVGMDKVPYLFKMPGTAGKMPQRAAARTQPAPAPAGPSLREQVAARRADKGSATQRAQALAARADKRVRSLKQSAKRSQAKQDTAGAVNKLQSAVTFAERRNKLMIRAGYYAGPTSKDKVIETTGRVIPAAPALSAPAPASSRFRMPGNAGESPQYVGKVRTAKQVAIRRQVLRKRAETTYYTGIKEGRNSAAAALRAAYRTVSDKVSGRDKATVSSPKTLVQTSEGRQILKQQAADFKNFPLLRRSDVREDMLKQAAKVGYSGPDAEKDKLRAMLLAFRGTRKIRQQYNAARAAARAAAR